MAGEKGVERRCRSEACGKWSFFKSGDPAKACLFCGAEFGKVELGLDVFVSPSRDKYPGGKRTVPAMNIDAPKPGEFGGGR